MFTRRNYIDKKCTHSEYYAQFVIDVYKARVNNLDLKSTPLVVWDNLPNIYSTTNDKMKQCGDYLTLSGKVCIYKEARRQLDENI